MFDATGASQPEGSSIAEQVLQDKTTGQAIDDLITAMHEIKGDKHRPRFLSITWGGLIFQGLLESATVNHKLFSPSGLPIRSVMSCTFKGHDSFEKQAAEQKKQSPDLTKFKQVREEDSIWLISEDTYESSNFYLEIARVNKLSNFRALKNGSSLRLPPIQKTNN